MPKMIQVTDRAPNAHEKSGNVRFINPDYIVSVGMGHFQCPSVINPQMMQIIPTPVIVCSGNAFPVCETVEQVMQKIKNAEFLPDAS